MKEKHYGAVQGKGNIWAAVVADSINFWGCRLTTFRLHYPRFIHAEFMTHRMFSRNASSSRAIPVTSMMKAIKEMPAMPVHWGKNQKGMQAKEECEQAIRLHDGSLMPREDFWETACNTALYHAEKFHEAGYHKQVVNRILEPFQFMNVVMSTTDVANFFHLRDHPDADPNLQELAHCMLNAYHNSQPEMLRHGEWHTPYVDHFRKDDMTLLYFSGDEEIEVEDAKKVSASCAAQASYRNLDTTVEKAIGLHERLVGGNQLHASPFEHVAMPFSEDEWSTRWKARELLKLAVIGGYDQVMYKGNFRGWTQYRKEMVGENICEYDEKNC